MIGIITGSGQYNIAELRETENVCIDTRYGEAKLTLGKLQKTEVAHIVRHGQNHELLPNMINHRANMTALKELGARSVLADTVVGVVDPALPLAAVIVFDDLFFPDNRLPEGNICTVFDEPGAADRAHCIFSHPYSSKVRDVVIEAAQASGVMVIDSGVYGHVHGPRFNTRAEVAWLKANSVTAISQTAGPETILAAELGLPFTLIGFGIDYANGASLEATPIATLEENLKQASECLPRILSSAAVKLDSMDIESEAFLYRFK